MAPRRSPRPLRARRTRCGIAVARLLAAAGMLIMATGAGIGVRPAHAQGSLTFPSRPTPPARPPLRAGADKQMLVRADEIDYDYTNNRVSAVGNVQIYY
jgi:LPS-assembly protein